jgi:hypothetical protein
MENRDQRAKHSFQVAIRAYVVKPATGEQFACVIRDGSISGCKVICSQIADLPDNIVVKVAKLKQTIKGRIVWRDTKSAGIEFNWEASNVDELRDAPRQEAFMPELISDHGLNHLADCVVMDASRSGCRILGEKVPELPEQISLTIDGLTAPIGGQIVWRTEEMAGIKFLWESEVYAPNEKVFI